MPECRREVVKVNGLGHLDVAVILRYYVDACLSVGFPEDSVEKTRKKTNWSKSLNVSLDKLVENYL